MFSSLRRRARRTLPPQILRVTRNTQRRLRRRPSPLLTLFGEGRCGGASIRPITRDDAPAWSAAMRANFTRMQRWWGLEGDEAARYADRLAFEHHLHAWQGRRRRGEGVCLGLIGPDGLVGELQVWHLRPGGMTCEIGLWMAPSDPATTKQAGACLGYAFDRLFSDLGIRRIDAPVAVANTLPRALLDVAGFEVDARIPQWRELNGRLVDYDLYGLTVERWAAGRESARAVIGRYEPDDFRPPSGAGVDRA